MFSGYVRLVTNLGPLNLELHCDVVPKTCENFLKHCENGYYDSTKLHRSIRNFMVNFTLSLSLSIIPSKTSRYKVEIQLVQGGVVNQFGANHLKMNLNQI